MTACLKVTTRRRRLLTTAVCTVLPALVGAVALVFVNADSFLDGLRLIVNAVGIGAAFVAFGASAWYGAIHQAEKSSRRHLLRNEISRTARNRCTPGD